MSVSQQFGYNALIQDSTAHRLILLSLSTYSIVDTVGQFAPPLQMFNSQSVNRSCRVVSKVRRESGR